MREAGDDHMGHLAFTAPALNMHPAMANTSLAMPDFSGVGPAADGEALWRDNCASCHGDSGKGDGVAAAWLQPPPDNLAEHSYRRGYLLQVLWQGKSGTAMPAWRDFPPAALLALVAQVEAFSVDRTENVEPGILAQGAEVYRTHCIQCHGEEGRGDGFAAAQFAVAAVDFTRQRPSLGQGLAVLANGIPGSPMAPWTDRLSEAEMLAVTAYLRTFFVADAASAGGDDVD